MSDRNGCTCSTRDPWATEHRDLCPLNGNFSRCRRCKMVMHRITKPAPPWCHDCAVARLAAAERVVEAARAWDAAIEAGFAGPGALEASTQAGERAIDAVHCSLKIIDCRVRQAHRAEVVAEILAYLRDRGHGRFCDQREVADYIEQKWGKRP